LHQTPELGLWLLFQNLFVHSQDMPMTHPFFAPDINAESTSGGQRGPRRSLQYLFDDVFVREPAAQAAALVCEPFSNDTPAPSGQTMREAPEDNAPKRLTLHLPPCRRTESQGATSIKS
jgi:hypothetical protein